MTTFTQSQGTRTEVMDIAALSSGNYKVSSTIDLGTNIPLDVTFEVVTFPSAATTGNKQLILFAKLSLDNTNFGSGPESGTVTTSEADLHWIGTLPCNDFSSHSKMFNISGLPITRYLKLVVKNDMGVVTASGKVYMANITGASA